MSVRVVLVSEIRTKGDEPSVLAKPAWARERTNAPGRIARLANHGQHGRDEDVDVDLVGDVVVDGDVEVDATVEARIGFKPGQTGAVVDAPIKPGRWVIERGHMEAMVASRVASTSTSPSRSTIKVSENRTNMAPTKSLVMEAA